MLRLVSWWVILAGSLSLADNVGDRFKAYVDKTIPLTHEVARKAAHAKEIASFVNRASLSQSHLAQATKWSLMIEKFLSAPRGNGTFCQTSRDGLVNVRELFLQASSLNESLNALHKVRDSVAEFRRLGATVEGACLDPQSYSAYNIEELKFDFHFPEKPELLDGVQLGWVFGGGEGARQENNSNRSDEAGGQFVDFLQWIPLVGAGVRMIRNHGIRVGIETQTARLKRDSAETGSYRQYAQESCVAIYKENKAVFQHYEILAIKLAAFVDRIPEQEIRERVSALQGCIENYAEQLKIFLEEEADALARRKFGRQADESRFFLKHRSLATDLSASLAKLDGPQSLACGQGGAEAELVGRLLAIARLAGAGEHVLFDRAWQTLNKRMLICGVEE